MLQDWRRAVLVFAPNSAKTVALALSEFAWASEGDKLIARHCPQSLLGELCGYKTDRGLLKQLKVLEEAGWLKRDENVRTGPGSHREYVLCQPDWITQDVRDELATPTSGMWRRLLQAKLERSPEPEFPRSKVVAVENTRTSVQVNGNHPNYSSGSPEPQFPNTRTTVPNHLNSSSPLKGVLSSSKLEGRESNASRDSPVGIRPNGKQPKFEQMLQACLKAGASGSDWKSVSDIVEQVFHFVPTEKQLKAIQTQLNDRQRK